MNRNILALDFGSGKITAALSAYDDETNTLRVRRTLLEPCVGINGSVILDLKGAERALSKIFADISEYVSFNPSVVVGVRGNFLSFLHTSGTKFREANLRPITQKDVDEAINNSIPSNLNENLEVLDVLPTGYMLDSQPRIDPLDLRGFYLEADTFITFALKTQLQNLNCMLEDCECTDYAAFPASVALAQTLMRPEEKKNTTLFLDIGGTNTSALLYHKGSILQGWEMPLGAEIIVQEVADILQSDLDSTRKTLSQYEYGDDEIVDDVLDEASKKLMKAIKKELLNSVDYLKFPPTSAVLSGGGTGESVREAAKNVFNLRKARLAVCEDLIPDAEGKEAVFATVIALTHHYLERETTEAVHSAKKEDSFLGGLLSRFGFN